jgi:glycosyltransferase involved in cell wall biosynthesis
MKILHVIVAFNPKFGGVVNICSMLTNRLSQNGHDVTIITSNYMYDSEYALTLKKVKIIPFPYIFRIGFFIITPGMKRWLIQNIKNFDVIHIHELQSYQNNMVSYFALKYGVPYILQAHGLDPSHMESSILKKMYNVVWGFKILKNATKLLALSKSEENEYLEMGVPLQKIIIVPNGIDLSKFKNLPQRGNFKRKFLIKNAEKVILFLARIHEQKGIDLLLVAFSKLIKSYPNVKLVFVGPDDGYLIKAQKLIQELSINEKTKFVGPLYNTDKIEAFIDADVYVLPSKYEGFPNTVLEALLCGTPIIVTTGCGISDILKDVGYVVSNNAMELEHTLNLVLSKDKDINMIQKGINLVENNYDLDLILKKIEDIYKGILQENYGNKN